MEFLKEEEEEDLVEVQAKVSVLCVVLIVNEDYIMR